MVEVVLAARDLPVGIPLTAEDLLTRTIPPDAIPSDPEKTFRSIDLVVSRTPKNRVLRGEIIRAERLARRDVGIGLNAIITPGMRAMAVQVKNHEAVAGFIRPGNYVDIIATIKPDDRSADVKAMSKTLLQGIKVLAVGGSMEGTSEEAPKKKSSRRSKPVVTVEVNLDQAEQLALAVVKGDIHLVLRADIDIDKPETEGATADSVLDIASLTPTRPTTSVRTAPAEPPVVEAPDIEVISGGTRTGVSFTEEGTEETAQSKKKRNR